MQSATSEIKKGKGINDVVRGITPGRVEDERRVEVVDENEFSELMDKCFKFVDDDNYRHLYDPDKLRASLRGYVLTPSQINYFLQATIELESCKGYAHSVCRFMRPLIQNSYDAGHNGFTLNTKDLPLIGSVGWSLKGTEDRLLMLGVEGDAGNILGLGARHACFTLNGNYVGDNLGSTAFYSTFILNVEDTGKDSGFVAGDCTFKTPNREVLSKLIDSVSRVDGDIFGKRKPSYNKIIFIHPDGTEETVRNYAKLNE